MIVAGGPPRRPVPPRRGVVGMSKEMDEMMQMGKTGPEHGRLESFAGKFKAEVKMWMGPGDPMVATGTMTNSLDLGGRYLRQDYKGDPSPGPFGSFEGRGYWGFNTGTKKYEGFWIDTASTMMQTETGTVDGAGKVWTMVGEMHDPSGKPMKKRSVITLKDKNTHSMEMFMEKDGHEFRTMEIQYKRIL
jgi:hypothetical protein